MRVRRRMFGVWSRKAKMTNPTACDRPASAMSHQRAGTWGKAGRKASAYARSDQSSATTPGPMMIARRAEPFTFTSGSWAYHTPAATSRTATIPSGQTTMRGAGAVSETGSVAVTD